MINRESTVRAFKKALDWCKKKSNVDSSWIKKSKLVELDHIDVAEDPVRPELDLEWRKSFGRKIMQEALRYAKEKGFQRVVTLSPLTPMATHYHIRNGAMLIGLNPSTQNFEYSLNK